MIADPSGVFCQSSNDTLVQAARSTIIDVFYASLCPQFGGFQSSGQRLILAPAPLLIDQKRESFQETEFVRGTILFLSLERLDHTLQPHGQEFFQQRLGQHDLRPPWSKYSAPRTLSWVSGGEL